MSKIIHVVGARPNFMKIAPVIEAINASAARKGCTVTQILVHTGQHYTPEMSSLMFEQLGLPTPDYNLEVGSGGHGQQTGRIMEAFEQVLLKEQPDLVVVVGDVNSTIACALDAKKLSIPVAHIEAGLRSFDREMPEEINRILTDAISDYLFTTEESARLNLVGEGIDGGKIFFVGNTMIDTLLKHKDAAKSRPILSQLNLMDGNHNTQAYGLVTLHRPSNVDRIEPLRELLTCLADLSKDLPLVMPIHPRTKANIEKFKLMHLIDSGNFLLIEPQGYLDFICLLSNAKLILSDSGGIQEEATVLGVPCLTLRENTERPITISEGTNTLVGNNPAAIVKAFNSALTKDFSEKRPKYWDGSAAQRIAEILLTHLA
ncbi:MAG: UDP-N-acetylglucosamine 2-epimerase (non-hydrolyzing) [Marinagarivorans sp.]